MNEYSWYNPLYYFSNVEIKVEKEIEKEEKIKLYIVHEEKLENSVKRLFASIVKKSFIEFISYKNKKELPDLQEKQGKVFVIIDGEKGRLQIYDEKQKEADYSMVIENCKSIDEIPYIVIINHIISYNLKDCLIEKEIKYILLNDNEKIKKYHENFKLWSCYNNFNFEQSNIVRNMIEYLEIINNIKN
jgi:hypothetical protein